MVKRNATLTCHQHGIKDTQPNQLSHPEVTQNSCLAASLLDVTLSPHPHPADQTPSVLRASPLALAGGEGVRPGISGITTVRAKDPHLLEVTFPSPRAPSHHFSVL